MKLAAKHVGKKFENGEELNATERLRYLAEKIESTNAGGDSLPTVESIIRDMEMFTAWKQIYTPWDLSVSFRRISETDRFQTLDGGVVSLAAK